MLFNKFLGKHVSRTKGKILPEKMISVECDLSEFSDAYNDESGWHFLKPQLEKYFASAINEFFCVPFLSVSCLFQPCSVFLPVPEAIKKHSSRTLDSTDDQTVKFCIPLGLFKDYVTLHAENEEFNKLFFNPQVVRFHDKELPETLNLALCDLKNKRRITLIAKNLIMLTADIISQQDDLRFVLNLTSLRKSIPLSARSSHEEPSETELKKSKDSRGSDKKKFVFKKPSMKKKISIVPSVTPEFPEINIITDVILAEQLNMSFFVEEIYRFLKFNTKKTLMFKFESFSVNEKNEILLNQPLKKHIKYIKWTQAPKIMNRRNSAAVYT